MQTESISISYVREEEILEKIWLNDKERVGTKCARFYGIERLQHVQRIDCTDSVQFSHSVVSNSL